MKKIPNLLGIIYILLLYYLVNNELKLIITMNFSISLLLYSIFSTTSIKDILNNYKYNKNKLLLYLILTIILLTIPISILSYLEGNILNINNLNITNILCTIFISINIIIKIIKEYQSNSKIYNIYYILLLLINIILLIIQKTKYNIIYLYITSIILFIIIFILLYILKLRKNKNKIKHNYLKDIKSILVTNKQQVLINIINSSYIYISTIILYYILTNKYINNNTNIILSNTYFFGIIFINILYKIIEKNIKIDNINNYNIIINKILNISLIICIPLMIISYPLSKVIYNSNYNILFPLIILLFFYIIYNTILNISINNISNKKINISMLSGLLIKIIFEIPLINSTYRMGYDITLGSILSTSLGLLITIILLTIFITKKYKINLLNNFNNILNIIYTNIIYLLILVLFTLIIKVDNTKYYINILVIIFYIFISIIFNIIKNKLNKRNANYEMHPLE